MKQNHNYRLGSKVLGVKERGFTLVELIIVVVIIGILAAISIIGYASYRDKATDTRIKADLKSLMDVARVYQANGNEFSNLQDFNRDSRLDDQDIQQFVDSPGHPMMTKAPTGPNHPYDFIISQDMNGVWGVYFGSLNFNDLGHYYCGVNWDLGSLGDTKTGCGTDG